MSAYRLNYTPEPQPRRRLLRSLAGYVVAALAAAACGLLIALALHASSPAAAPVPDAAAQTPAPANSAAPTLVEMRLRAFRAGYESALQAGCRPVLAPPILGQRP